MSPSFILWIYIVLLFVGGLIGFFKAKSSVSLIMSASFAALLVLCNVNVITQRNIPDILMAILLVVFAIRLAKTKKFMPAGMMGLVTIAALVLRHVRIG